MPRIKAVCIQATRASHRKSTAWGRDAGGSGFRDELSRKAFCPNRVDQSFGMVAIVGECQNEEHNLEEKASPDSKLKNRRR
eukprot:3385635-Alexandrium_andersonii.AAC.1